MSHPPGGADAEAEAEAARRRIAWLPCSPTGEVASARLRALLPCEYLSERGWRTAIVRRGQRARYDCAVFQKPYDAVDVALAERLVRRRHKVVVDLCDNLFYNPEGLPELDARAGRLRRMIDLADAVVVSTPGLADVVGGSPVFVVNDALDVPAQGKFTGALAASLAAGARPPEPGRPVRLVWFGNSGSVGLPFGMQFLEGLVPELERLHRRLPLTLTVISNAEPRFRRSIGAAGFPTRYVEWTLDGFAAEFVGHDVCLMPLERNPITLCKSANRLALALSLGVPVVADSIPSYEEFAECVLFGDWERSIESYANDPALRVRHLEGARQLLERAYTPERVAQEWVAVFAAVLRR